MIVRSLVLALAVVGCAGSLTLAQASPPATNMGSIVADELQASKDLGPEIARIFAADQADRSTDHPRFGIIKADRARRDQTKALLNSGSLRSASDFEAAAFVFQHGDASDDYLLAHTLATVAVAKGRPNAIWIAAATLDRYLLSAGRPQIYGTQCRRIEGRWTSNPLNRRLVSDALRTELRVRSASEQEAKCLQLQARSSR